MNTEVKQEYKTVASTEYGSGYGFRIQMMGIDREITEYERDAIYKAQDLIADALLKGNTDANPETHKKAARDKDAILACFGGNALYVDDIPNGYCSRGCCAFYPWFMVTTPVGRIKIGWRKRVINIDWSDTKIRVRGEEITEDDVTKGKDYIHAYGYEKAAEYLAKLFKLAGKE